MSQYDDDAECLGDLCENCGDPFADCECGEESTCAACGQALGLPGGMAGTGLCGPCCTGEAATVEEIGETW